MRNSASYSSIEFSFANRDTGSKMRRQMCECVDPERAVIMYRYEMASFSTTQYNYFCVTNIQLITEVLG